MLLFLWDKHMSRAKYYIYRNLHQDCFSVKYKGIVVSRATNIIAINPSFQVSEKGRQKVISERRKNVHAYVVCDDFLLDPQYYEVVNKGEVKYNPYQNESFQCDGQPIFKSDYAQLTIVNKKSKVIHGSSITLVEEGTTGNDNG